MADEIPVIDLSDVDVAAPAIDRACRETGFFYVVGHGVDPALGQRLDALAREFFALPEEEKAEIAMTRGGRAWRGWFPIGGELTSGVADRKEGIYFGSELGPEHPLVRDGVVLHGRNLFPARPAQLGPTVLAYLDALTGVAHRLAECLAQALGLDRRWFAEHLTSDPLILFRIFHYPPDPSPGEWGVGEHTDYGLLTLLRQDDAGGLEVRSAGGGWMDAPPIPNSFVCNLGDMLERMTGGVYRSTPHRVRNTSGVSRLSFPFFFDPGWNVVVPPLPRDDGVADRWDGADPTVFEGTYGEYVSAKVAKVFPDLHRQSAS
ncbi:MAG TPA: 2-oxoglutarate and iron-dependent oxygenase domain-containing protein [Acidimicrobiales bacterium]|nr:2-oxoglutarate and iron-dependent oxygenase domain-containing protein [Acidimicrobiales bacterium]